MNIIIGCIVVVFCIFASWLIAHRISVGRKKELDAAINKNPANEELLRLVHNMEYGNNNSQNSELMEKYLTRKLEEHLMWEQHNGE